MIHELYYTLYSFAHACLRTRLSIYHRCLAQELDLELQLQLQLIHELEPPLEMKLMKHGYMD